MGQWIRGETYYAWIERLARPTVEVHDVPPARDQPRAKLCPECHKIMRRFEVGHGVEFCIDRCGTCAGVWFDANEWEQVQAHQLADRVHFVFSAAWQTELQRERREEVERARLQQHIGDVDFARLQEVSEWIRDHPHRDELIAWLVEGVRQQQPSRTP
jgi:Zn-finger nucleic acid-binding protein